VVFAIGESVILLSGPAAGLAGSNQAFTAGTPFGACTSWRGKPALPYLVSYINVSTSEVTRVADILRQMAQAGRQGSGAVRYDVLQRITP
jgi:hypothetical protein